MPSGPGEPGGPVRQVSCQDIQLVQNLIERCLQLYMSRQEVVDKLVCQAKIEPSFTELVWQKLEEENEEFFRAYYTRLMLKQQIVEFNRLLDQQLHLMHSNSLSASNGSHNPAVASLPASNGSHISAVSSLSNSNGSHIPTISSLPASNGSHIPAVSSLPNSNGSHIPTIASLPASNGSQIPAVSSLPNSNGSHITAVSSLPISNGSHIPRIPSLLNSNGSHITAVSSLPNSNGSHIPTRHENPTCYSAERPQPDLMSENMQHSVNSRLSNTFNNGGPSLHTRMHTVVDMSSHGIGINGSPSMLSAQNSNLGMMQGINGGMIKLEPGYSDCSYMFSTGGNVPTRPNTADASVTSFTNVAPNAHAVNDAVLETDSSFGFLGQIPRNFSLSDLTADFSLSSDILDSYSRSPFLPTDNNFLEKVEQDNNRLDSISEGLSHEDFGSE
ncbi:uncharacterized protein LOC130730104 isoform X3 [Lotus japonicus]|uniref:uncharacterized protein LOC130730104 isoform X3 n=1 Tax=Lotus japonicus TaxID=34305 RepID=UPI0025867E35|nr:uncharacterized protein LOC130730104 isoform X3 [Lotus japonicus]